MDKIRVIICSLDSAITTDCNNNIRVNDKRKIRLGLGKLD